MRGVVFGFLENLLGFDFVMAYRSFGVYIETKLGRKPTLVELQKESERRNPTSKKGHRWMKLRLEQKFYPKSLIFVAFYFSEMGDFFWALFFF